MTDKPEQLSEMLLREAEVSFLCQHGRTLPKLWFACSALGLAAPLDGNTRMHVGLQLTAVSIIVTVGPLGNPVLLLDVFCRILQQILTCFVR